MDLTVVIADSDDLRIKNCVDSIDEDVQVMVSLNNPSSELSSLVEEMEVDSCYLPTKGLAAALNNGIRNAKYDKIIIIDSDCTFHRGTIKKLYGALDTYKMCRGVQETLYDNFISKIISKAREFHGNTNPNPSVEEIRAYKPLAYRKSIISQMGGQIYNPVLKLSEDFEMNERRKKAGIELGFIPEAVIYHTPISLISDLRSAFKYGKDRFTMVQRELTSPKKNFVSSLIKLKNKCIPRFGFLVTSYMVLWTIAYDYGYWSKKVTKVK